MNPGRGSTSKDVRATRLGYSSLVTMYRDSNAPMMEPSSRYG
jgi:hypothetical protein